MPGTPDRRWTEARIRRELGEFLADRNEWPTYREFVRKGRRGLRDAVTRTGGTRRWARELGVAHPRHRSGYATRWTEQRIQSELQDFLAGREAWPARAEFEVAGRKPLRDAIQRTGGPDRWARDLEVARNDRRAGLRRGWTAEAIHRELAQLLEGRTTWPSKSEFKVAGATSLLTAVYTYGGPEVWARRLGVRRRPWRRPTPDRRRWTEERVRDALADFCVGWERWPTQREFEQAGHAALYHAASRLEASIAGPGSLGWSGEAQVDATINRIRRRAMRLAPTAATAADGLYVTPNCVP